ncbi:MAG TPA: DUF5655 domain-containing protein [Bdellovibrionales bacterium]|nr:DUF5655 domain-containing protein [Bdellovibrionales bacterium]
MQKKRVDGKSPRKVKTKKAKKKQNRAPARHWNCEYCLAPISEGKPHDCVPMTEQELFADVAEDLRDAFKTLRAEASRFGEQRIYNNARAVMFSRRVCYMFVRPKKSYLELCFFLPRKELSGSIHRVAPVSKTKLAHTVKLVHSDQVEAPLTRWLKEAFDSAQ